MNNILLKLPNFEGGFISKSIEGDNIVSRDDNSIIDVEGVNHVRKGIICKYGEIKEYSDTKVVLKKGLKFDIYDKEEINKHLRKALTEPKTEVLSNSFIKSHLSGEYETPIGKVRIGESVPTHSIKTYEQIKAIKSVLVSPDKIDNRTDNYIFSSTVGNEEHYLVISKGNVKKSNTFLGKVFKKKNIEGEKVFKSYKTLVKPIKLKFKSQILEFKPPVTNGTSLSRGMERPNHKYIERRPHPSGKGYIYLYKLPSGAKKWKDDSGKEVSEPKSEKENIEGFRVGDSIKIGDRAGRVKEVSDNFLAVDFDGEVEVISKKEHVDRLGEHSEFKEGQTINYKGEEAEILRKTDKVALIMTSDKKLKVIKLEKPYGKINGTQIVEESEYSDEDVRYEDQPEYQEFDKVTKELGFGNATDELSRKKYIKIGSEIRTVKWSYNPKTKDIDYLIDGTKDYSIDFMGNSYYVRNITEEGYSLEDSETGETGIFLEHKDYNRYKDEGKNVESVKTDNAGGTIVRLKGKTYHFGGNYAEEDKKRVSGKASRSNYRSRWRRNEPIQTPEDIERIAKENEAKRAKLKEALNSKEYKNFEKEVVGRGFKIQENKFIAKKEIETQGRKFAIRSVFDKNSRAWKSGVEGKTKTLKLGDGEYKITDVSKDSVSYDENGEEKTIGFDELHQINGKALFEPTKESKGIISKNEPQKIYFSTDDKNVVSAYYEVVEADDIIASHNSDGEINKDYTIGDAQNRDRSSSHSLAQINKIANDPNFDFVSDDRTAQNGAPIVDENYNVIAGNGRAIGLQLHYKNKSDKYKNDLIRNANRLGFKKDEIEQMNSPILVRRTNADNKEAQRLGAISNQDQKLALEEREAAKGMATRIDDKTINSISRMFEGTKEDYSSMMEYLNDIGGDIVGELSKKGVIPENERHLYYDVDTGKLNSTHKEKLQQLLTQTMLGDSTREFEDIPNSAREAIAKGTGTLFHLKGKQGDLTEHVRDAVKYLNKYESMKDSFKGLDDFIAQDSNNMLNPLKASKETLSLMETLNSGKSNELKNKLNEYKLLMEGDMFSAGLSPDEAFDKAFQPKYKEGVNKSFWKRLFKSGNLQLLSSKKNPMVKRWQSTDEEVNKKKELVPENNEIISKTQEFKDRIKNIVGKNFYRVVKHDEEEDFEDIDDSEIEEFILDELEPNFIDENTFSYKDAEEEREEELRGEYRSEVETTSPYYVVGETSEYRVNFDEDEPNDSTYYIEEFLGIPDEDTNKSIDLTKNALLPSKKTPKVRRWQRIEVNNRGGKMTNNVIAFAKERHNGQKYNEESYFDLHLKKVANETLKIAQACKYKKPHLAFSVAYLHDVLEDTKTTRDELDVRFGKEVTDAVVSLTNSRNGVKKGKEDYYRDISENEMAKIVKAADRICNVRALKDLKQSSTRERLIKRYKDEMKYFEKYKIFPELVKKAFDI